MRSSFYPDGGDGRWNVRESWIFSLPLSFPPWFAEPHFGRSKVKAHLQSKMVEIANQKVLFLHQEQKIREKDTDHDEQILALHSQVLLFFSNWMEACLEHPCKEDRDQSFGTISRILQDPSEDQAFFNCGCKPSESCPSKHVSLSLFCISVCDMRRELLSSQMGCWAIFTWKSTCQTLYLLATN